MDVLAYILAAVWGLIWAAVLQYTEIGGFLALKRTWMTVVIGIGVDLLIAMAVVPTEVWVKVFVIIAASSLGVIARSLNNEWGELREVLDVKNQDSQ